MKTKKKICKHFVVLSAFLKDFKRFKKICCVRLMKTLQLQSTFKYLEILIDYINKFLFLVVKKVCEYLEIFVLRIKQTLNDIQIKVKFPLHT